MRKDERRIPTVQMLALACALLCAPLSMSTGAAAQPLETLDRRLFPVPPEISANVVFWTKVYTEYDNSVVLLHDEKYLQVVYAALDFSDLEENEPSPGKRSLVKRTEIRKAREKYRSILSSLAAGKASKAYPRDQERVEQLFDSVPGDRRKYSAAANRLRTQTCLRNRFAEGIERSGIYMPTMEEIFAARDLPLDLTRLPFVESLFQWHARSSVAAGGIWQFMPSTARSYLTMDLEYDERFDPLRATEGAATLLSENYEALQTWPLAITAYNHGRNGMKRAVRRLGTRDFGTIVEKYQSRTFGFASRNFYSEFIAAAEIYLNREHYFPDVEPLGELRFEEFRPPAYVALLDLAQAEGMSASELQEMNPALSREVWRGHLFLPKSYPLKVPAGRLASFQAAFDSLSETRKSPHQVGLRYKVRRGDTLGTIAARFGSSVRGIQQANGLRSANHIVVGQRLLIPPRDGRAASARGRSHPVSTVASAPGKNRTTGSPGFHVVRSGETLTSIARRYGTTARDLLATNSLSSPDRLAVGQRLQLPGGAAQKQHVVRRGDTLSRIAERYGTSISALRRANRLSGSHIVPGQVLVVP